MIEVVIIVVVLVVLIPVGFLMSTTLAAALIGHLLKTNADDAHAGSELLDCSD